jgi:hypothetical protein
MGVNRAILQFAGKVRLFGEPDANHTITRLTPALRLKADESPLLVP